MNRHRERESRRLANKEIQKEIAGWAQFNRQEKQLRSTPENNLAKRAALALVVARLSKQ